MEDALVSPTRFRISETILAQLRARRVDQRAVRKTGNAAIGTRPESILDSFRRLVESREPDVKVAAEQFVLSMNTLQDEVEDAHDAFLLDPGMGPMTYLTSDGRVLLDFRSWDGDPLREADENEAIGAILVGAKKTGVTALLDLLPAAPHGARPCPECGGRRWTVVGGQHEIVCGRCHGRGWA
jgi:hypothetical protein